MSRTLQYVVLAWALCSVRSSAQTIVVDGVTLAANASTITPASRIFDGEEILTEDVLANLNSLALTDIHAFAFATNDSGIKGHTVKQCKAYPGDLDWPAQTTWDVFDLLTGFALIKDVPLASACYESWATYDADVCTAITAQWANVSLHLDSPSDLMFPLWQGATCLPPSVLTNEPSGNCTVGGFPTYIVNATNIAQIQLAVNFARNLNLRLVIKNTGHDFNGRSAGAGALSIWTHSFSDIEFLPSYRTESYSGPAMKIGTGVETKELYAAAEQYGVTAVGGLCTTVATGGGYLAGGGHSPMSSLLGLGADQVLSVDVVTADGHFVTADETRNSDLFWALRGGGGSTFGVTTSWTIKVAPKLSSASVTKFSISSGVGSLTAETLWQGIRAFFLAIPAYNDAGSYEYFEILSMGGQLTFAVTAWFAPNMTAAEHHALISPLLETWKGLGIDINATFQEFSSYLPAWEQLIDAEAVGGVTYRSSNRLIPLENLMNETLFNQTFAAIQDLARLSGILVAYGISANPPNAPDNAVNPAWRNNALYLISSLGWSPNLTWSEVSDMSLNFTNNWTKPLRDLTPGAGSYSSEGDLLEPDWQQSFYGGGAIYDRLAKFKQQVDPTGLFYAHQAVGSEYWYVTDQLEGLPTQNGRLCRR